MKRFCFFLLNFCLLLNARAQIFGGTPPAIRWQSIHTVPANIIFPSGLEEEARQVAVLISSLSKTTLSTIGTRQKPIDIVFHNLTTISNGYVQLAPFRSEFELTAPQNSFDLGSLPWNQTLAIHEYRHVQQYNNFNVGISKLFYILAGQDGLAFANNLSVPNWFWEGDAVYQETLVSQQGRGRLPLFLSGFEALWLSGKKYSWMKIRNGSYRDYTPNHYPLGYMMVAYGREKYGDDFWARTAVEAAAFKGFFYPLQHAIRKNAGISFDTFRTMALDYFRKQLPEKAYESPEAVFGKASPHFVADELFPQWMDSNRLVYLYSSYRLPPSFVVQDTWNKKATRIKYQAVSNDDAFTYRDGKIIYSAYEPDIRWGWRDYSVLRILDLNTGKDIRITNKSKYFSPDISPDGKRIVAVKLNPSGNSYLDILDLHSGKLLMEIPNPGRLVFSYPKYFTEEQLVVAARNEKGQMSLMQIEINSGAQKILADWSMDVIGFVSVNGNQIYFSRTADREDRGFCWRDGQVYRLQADAATGNYQLASGFGRLAWNGLSSAGFRLQVTDIHTAFSIVPETFELQDSSEKHRIYNLDHPPFQIPSPIPDSLFPVKKYPDLTFPFNFHSWRPFINDPDYTLALVGENVLNTLQSEIFIGYNSNEQYKKAGMDFTYGGLFPFLNLGVEYRIDRNGYFNGNKIYWNELLPYAGVSVPLNFSRGIWLTNLEGGVNYTYHQYYFSGVYKDSLRNSGYFSLDPQLLFTHQLQAGRMQINPSFAQTLLLMYNRAISNLKGDQFLASGNFFFPGLSSTNSLVVRASFQQRDSLNQLRFSNSFPFSRGYSGENFYQMYGFGLNYNFPLAYPDWGFGNMIYFLRIRANMFYDYTAVPFYVTNGPGVQSQYRSAGLEIYLDTQWWNELPLSFGIRYSRLLDPDYTGRGPNQWEFILPLNILANGYSHHQINP
jgi:hypothetical protein